MKKKSRKALIDYVNVENFCVDGECSRCGECCGDYLPLTDHELKVIKEYVLKHNIKPYKDNLRSADLDLTCPFYNAQKKECMIYNIRPSICRVFKCNMPFNEIRKQKNEFHNNLYRRIVSFRSELFGETNVFFRVLDEALTRKE